MTFTLSRLIRWPWNGLAWKIFFWFWLTMIAMLSTLFIAFATTISPIYLLSKKSVLLEELNLKSQNTQQLSDTPSRTSSLQSSYRQGNNYLLSDMTGKAINNNTISNKLLEPYKENRQKNKPATPCQKGIIIGTKNVTLNNQIYQLYLIKTMPRLMHWRIKQIFMHHWLFFAIAISISFILCIILASYLVAPIKQLQNASQKLAKGFLDTRAGRNVICRKDELGELGKDFDMMAEQLESLMHNKQQLLRNVSHELRSPLTRLQLSLALARKKTPSPNTEHDRIEREIKRLDQLIDKIIRYSRIQYGVAEQAWEKINLQSLITQLIDDSNFEAQAFNKSVIFIKTNEVQIWAVRDFIFSAIENIIRNAIRFTPEEKNVEVSLEQQGLYAIIIVRDYGPGVPENTLNALFDPFFRLDSTRGRENNGTGLGMAIADSAITFHQGTISASNAQPGLQVKIKLLLPTKS